MMKQICAVAGANAEAAGLLGLRKTRADVILTDLTTNLPVPLGGAPGGPWDTQLKPSTNYGFSAVVHNDADTPATGVKVTFWSIP